MKSKFQKIIGLMMGMMLISQGVFASGANEGEGTFRGQLMADMGIDSVTMLSGMKDIQFFSYNEAIAGKSIPVCIYTNAPSGQFTVTLTSSYNGNANMFYLAHENGDDQTEMKVALSASNLPAVELQHGAMMGPYSITTESVHCNGANDEKHDLKIALHPSVTSEQLTPGKYSGTFSLRIDAV